MERVNRDIKTLFRLSFGTTNFERMRNRIMYSLNSDSPILYNRKQKTNKRNMRPRGPYKKINIYLFWSYVKRSVFQHSFVVIVGTPVRLELIHTPICLEFYTTQIL